jgi:hypothetical protein
VFLNSTDILLYKKYNNYYITGVNTIVKDNELLRNKIIDDDKILLNKNKMLSNVNDILVNSANTDVNISTIDEINIEELGDNIPSNL